MLLVGCASVNWVYEHCVLIWVCFSAFFLSFQLVSIGFAVSALASNWERLGKPFNPLLGETFEYQNDDFRIVCEQVSHHPPVSAFHADSSHFKFYGAMYVYKFITYLSRYFPWSFELCKQPKKIIIVDFWNFDDLFQISIIDIRNWNSGVKVLKSNQRALSPLN